MTVLLPLELHNVHSKFVVDTGSVVTVVSSAVYNSIPLHRRPSLQPAKEPVKGEAANKEMMDIDGVATVKFVANGEHFEWEMYVAPIAEEGLIGMDFFHAHDYILSARAGMKLNGRKVATEVQIATCRTMNVATRADTVVPTNSQCIVYGCANITNFQAGLGSVEPPIRNPHQVDRCRDQGCLVGSALVDLKGQGSQAVIPVRLVNSSNTDVVIKKGAAVASLHEVEDFAVIFDSEAAGAMGPQTHCVSGDNTGVCN